MNDLQSFYGPNAGYVLDLYERYRENPDAVDPATRAIFERWTPMVGVGLAPTLPAQQPTVLAQPYQLAHAVAASALAHSIRERGHLGARLDPLGTEPLGDPALSPENYHITDADLAQLPPIVVGGHSAARAANALEAIINLRAMYSGPISYEFDQVKSPLERGWLRDAVGLNRYHAQPDPEADRKLLRRLTQVDSFERFLQQTYPGQKRFSLEGTDMLVPMLDELIASSVESGTREIIIGMAHRGRLNVLAHVLGKSYEAILSEFSHSRHEEGVPLTDTFGFGWTGDVKYHLGYQNVLGEDASVSVKISLSPNPSHLEYVNPVIDGMARAAQEDTHHPGVPMQEADCALPIVIHGDAAFPGEGIVAETLNLWHLQGYWVGGAIHIILNNQLGFTTDPQDSRSTHFASDLAKGFEIPIIHANADHPGACITAIRLAHAFRDQFHKDVLVDLIGYRRWGHNEGDEPAFTQPKMYEIIRSHPTVRELYARSLAGEGAIQSSEADDMVKAAFATLEAAKQKVDNGLVAEERQPADLNGHVGLVETPPPLSAVQLTRFNTELLTWPQDFAPHPKLERLLQRRANTLGPDGGIDWGQAEALAFASILAAGTPIRLTGQDSQRGTFSHRHAVLHDHRNGETYVPLQHLSEARASFSIFNSPLSEAAVLGFEYGYSVRAPERLVLWEAQFGDFANAAQVIIDQFISSGYAKWRQESSLVMLLPHGYEGQGPEHSSARPERYLQLAAHNNWQVANCSTAFQYFHLLRQQAYNLTRNPRPLIIFTPKSLLRHPLAAATLDDLVHGTFLPVLDDPLAQQHPGDIHKLVLCTGKIAIDLLASERRAQSTDVALVRVEMLYPFPEEQLRSVLSRYPALQEITWVQEEPRNMGAWNYISTRLNSLAASSVTISVISRPELASPATGFMDVFQAQQEVIIKQAFASSIKQRGGKYVG